MKKVVVNACYGGYGWSNTAINEYLKRKGIKHKYTIESGSSYWPCPEEECLHTETGQILVEKEGIWTPFFGFEIERDDEVAVSVLEDLGSKACSNIYSQLRIEEYDDTKYTYEVDEYDGLERLILIPIVTEDFLRSHTTDEIVAYLDEVGVLTKPA